jgi:hypothetical protein
MYTSKTRIALGRGTGESAPSCGATKTLLNDPTPNGETRHTQSIWDRYITMPVQQFLVAAGFGRTKLYDLLSSGELDSVVIGRRRLILMDSYRRLIERQRAPPLQDLKELPITAAQRCGNHRGLKRCRRSEGAARWHGQRASKTQTTTPQ